MDLYGCHYCCCCTHGCHRRIRMSAIFHISAGLTWVLFPACWKYRTRQRGLGGSPRSVRITTVSIKVGTCFLIFLIRFFGLVILPIVSFAADGAVAIIYFFRSLYHHFFQIKAMEPIPLAKARAIDLSIQFSLFWMPTLVLLGWWTHKPFHLLFGMLSDLINDGST